MMEHLFKLMWNQKRKNLGLLLEVFVSFLVIFAVFSFLIFNIKRYREPLGFDYQQILTVELQPGYAPSLQEEERQKVDSIYLDLVARQLRSYPELDDFTIVSGFPYADNMSQTFLVPHEEVIHTQVCATDEKFADVMNLEMADGQWFTRADYQPGAPIPIVINRTLEAMLYPGESALGRELTGMGKKKMQIIGIIDHFRDGGEFSESVPQFFMPFWANDWTPTAFAMKVKNGVGGPVKARLFNDIKQITKNWKMEIAYLDDLRQQKLMTTWIPVFLCLIVGGFLIFNVALGLFGVIWQNINKRKPEIGIRRAVGATQVSICAQVMGETLALATLSLAVGVFFAVQFPLLDVFHLDTEVYLMAIALAIGFIYLVVLLCSFYPGVLAGRIHPAVALYEE